MKNFFRNLGKKSDFGLVLDWNFHVRNKWVSAYTPYLVNAIITEFDPVIIDSQLIYNLKKDNLKYLLSFEPGIQSPRITYDVKVNCKKGVIYSDPHYKPDERYRYVIENGIDFIFSLYKRPFFHHFKGFPEDRFVHWPWAVPDQFISDHPFEVRSNQVAIFGGRQSDAYDVRNWCREQPGITSFEFSGVENKKLDDVEFYRWITRFDAIVAAGSSNPAFDLVTPKYFEIAAAGALLIGQYCEDLADLGFSAANALIFTKEEFHQCLADYRCQPERYLGRRIKGRELIRERHKLSDRIRTIREVFGVF
ncbi:MAG: glycosyltransferase [Desulfuromonadales bacterium]|nr:glycosyltransferase [Desulfuromonadales bacterium]